MRKKIKGKEKEFPSTASSRMRLPKSNSVDIRSFTNHLRSVFVEMMTLSRLRMIHDAHFCKLLGGPDF
jgi:hypothetical protein